VHKGTREEVRLLDNQVLHRARKEEGKKVAIVAAARKLMRAMYIMLKEEQAFRLDG
jgi:hypothetical protein